MKLHQTQFSVAFLNFFAMIFHLSIGQTFYHSPNFNGESTDIPYTYIGQMTPSRCAYYCVINKCKIMMLAGTECSLANVGQDASVVWNGNTLVHQFTQLVLTNLGFEKPTYASPAISSAKSANKANSGNIALGDTYISLTFSNAYWMVDLGSLHLISSLIIYCETTVQLYYFKIYTSNSSILPTSSAGMTLYAFTGNAGIDPQYRGIEIPPPVGIKTIWVRFVRLEKSINAQITLNELQVMGYLYN